MHRHGSGDVYNRQTIMKSILILLASAAILPAAHSRAPAWIAEYAYQPAEVQPFAFGLRGAPEVPIVSVTLQEESFPLILDTGTAGYASLDLDVISRLRLPVKSWTTWLDSSGKPAGKIPRAVVPSLQFGSIRVTDAEITGMGPESVMGKREGFVGTLGWWSFRDSRITLDYRNRLIAISHSPLPAGIKSCATRYVTPFVSPSDLNGLVLIEAYLSGTRFYAEVDTGKSKTVLDPRIQTLRRFEKESQGYVIDGIAVGPFIVRSRSGRMFGGFGGFSKGLDKPVYVGLGSDFLQDFLLTIDYGSRRVVLEQKRCDDALPH